MKKMDLKDEKPRGALSDVEDLSASVATWLCRATCDERSRS